jgi:hypothetical protein
LSLPPPSGAPAGALFDESTFLTNKAASLGLNDLPAH